MVMVPPGHSLIPCLSPRTASPLNPFFWFPLSCQAPFCTAMLYPAARGSSFNLELQCHSLTASPGSLHSNHTDHPHLRAFAPTVPPPCMPFSQKPDLSYFSFKVTWSDHQSIIAAYSRPFITASCFVTLTVLCNFKNYDCTIFLVFCLASRVDCKCRRPGTKSIFSPFGMMPNIQKVLRTHIIDQ